MNTKKYIHLILKPLYRWKVILVRSFIILMFIEVALYVATKLDFLANHSEEFTILDKGAPVPESYINVDWYKDYVKEFLEVPSSVGWSPYVYKRTKPFKGKYINVSNNSKRKTWVPPQTKNNRLKIFMFGGSTMWGWGARDDYTIPSLIGKILYNEYGVNAEITNFGQLGFVSTQEVICLIRELHRQNFPHVVIFYDGLNDVFCALRPGQTGIVGVSCDECEREEAFEKEKAFKDSNILEKILKLYTTHSMLYYTICEILNKKPSVTLSQTQLDSLSNDILDVYKENINIVKSMSDFYHFKVLFYWQPIIFTKNYLTNYEKKLEKAGETHLYSKPLYELIYKKVAYLKNNKAFNNISNILSGYKRSFYIDYSHIDEMGNEVVARKIAKDILNLRHM